MIRAARLCRLIRRHVAGVRNVALGAVVVCTVSACESGAGSNPENAAGSITAVSSTASEIQVNAGATVSVPISVVRTAGFIGTVDLSIDGVPNGVTFSFSPAVLAFGQSTSSLTLVLAQGAAAGSYPLVVRASAKSVESRTVAIALVVPAPSVTVSTGIGSISIPLEDTVSIPVTVTRTGGGFIDPVTLAVNGLPTGVSASLVPQILTGSATTTLLKLTAALGAAVGASTMQIVVSGISVAPKSTSLPFTVLDALQPTFRVMPTFPSINVPFGGDAVELIIAVPRGGGLSAPVVLSAEGLPAGVQATFTPATVTGASTILRLTALRSAIAGTYPLTVRGVATGVSERVGLFSGTVSGVRLAAQPTSVRRGTDGTFDMTMTRYGTYSEAASVTIEAPVPGFGFTGFPLEVSADIRPSFRSLPFTVAGSVAAGTYNVVIRATDQSGVVATTNLVVTVTN